MHITLFGDPNSELFFIFKEEKKSIFIEILGELSGGGGGAHTREASLAIARSKGLLLPGLVEFAFVLRTVCIRVFPASHLVRAIECQRECVSSCLQ